MEGNEEFTDEQALATQANTMQRRDLGGTSLTVENQATAALVAKARADIEARWVMAMRMPRNLDLVRQEIIRECKRPGFAEAAIYYRPVGGGKVAEGLSIRFAEVAMRCFRNMPCETQTIYDSDAERIVRVTVTDLEANVTWSKDITIKKTVERKQLKRGQRSLSDRINSYGDRVFLVEATEDDVAVKEAAMISKTARTLILRCIPGNIQDEAKALCKQIAADKTAADPAAARNRIFDAFATLNVMPPDLEKWLGHSVQQATPVELENLRGLYMAIRDGETTWADALAGVPDAAKAPAAKPAPVAPTGGSPPTPADVASAPQAQPQAKPEAPAKPSGSKGTSKLKETMASTKPAESEPVTTAAASAAQPTVKIVESPGPEGEKFACSDCGVPLLFPGRCDACANA